MHHIGQAHTWQLVRSQGDSLNLHGIHWHGNVVRDQGRHTDSVRALSGTTRSLDLVADNPGTWFFHCHVRKLCSSTADFYFFTTILERFGL